MKIFFLSLGILFVALTVLAQPNDFDRFSAGFVKGYNALKLPQL